MEPILGKLAHTSRETKIEKAFRIYEDKNNKMELCFYTQL